MENLTDEMKLRMVEALEEAANASTFGIVSDKRLAIGTGTAILWNKRAYILTAGHVLDGLNRDELRFLVRSPGNIERAYIRDPLDDQRMHPSRLLPIGDLIRDPSEDLAVIPVLEPDLVTRDYQVTFHEIPRFKQINFGGIVMLQGHPKALTRLVHGLEGASYRSIQHLRMSEDSGSGLQNFDAGNHILLDFDAEAEGLHPRGFSGAAVWTYMEPGSEIWHAHLLLGGVVKSYYERRKVILAIRGERILAFLDSLG